MWIIKTTSQKKVKNIKNDTILHWNESFRWNYLFGFNFMMSIIFIGFLECISFSTNYTAAGGGKGTGDSWDTEVWRSITGFEKTSERVFGDHILVSMSP